MAYMEGKTSKIGVSGLENSKNRRQNSGTQESAYVCTTDFSWNDGGNCDEWNGGWSFDEWNDDWSSVGWHEGLEQTYDTSASSFSLGGLDVSATSCPKRFGWGENESGHRSCSEHIPLNFGPEGAGDGRFYRTASGEWILDGGFDSSKDTTKTDCSDL